jgi:archaellum component FlaC
MEILNFLLPIHFSPFKVEVLPIAFFVIIWGLFIFTITRVYKEAKPENWEHNWYGGDVNNTANDLDAEHGSVMEISEAVATSSEKLADIMPGMILIIGLLGTFLGLGLALDKASSILTGANAMNNMDASMTQLMGMLEGLGTKFKTSTWGLLAFILLKVILSKNGYEERRLRWSIEKVKGELDLARDRQLKEQRRNNQNIIDNMQTIAQLFVETIGNNQTKNQELFQQLSRHSEESKNAMVGFIEKNEATVSSLGKSATGMSKAAVQMGESAKHLQNVIDSFRSNMESVVDLMKEDLNSTITGMNESFGQNMAEMSEGLNKATKDISNAVNSLSGSVDETMKTVTSTINESMELQKKSQGQFTTTVQVLRKEILEMTNLVKELTEGINNQFGAVTNGIKRTEHVGKKIEELTNTVNGTFKESLQSIEAVTTLKPTLENLVHGIDSQITLLGKIEINTSPEQQKKVNNLLKLGGRT